MGYPVRGLEVRKQIREVRQFLEAHLYDDFGACGSTGKISSWRSNFSASRRSSSGTPSIKLIVPILRDALFHQKSVENANVKQNVRNSDAFSTENRHSLVSGHDLVVMGCRFRQHVHNRVVRLIPHQNPPNPFRDAIPHSLVPTEIGRNVHKFGMHVLPNSSLKRFLNDCSRP